MAFDLSTATPVSSGFDLSSAQPVKPKPKVDSFDPTEGMSSGQLVAAGAGKAAVDLTKGTAQTQLPGPLGALPGLGSLITGISGLARMAVGPQTRESIAEDRARDAPLMSTGAGRTGNFIGNVAAMVPTAAIPGANTMTGAAALGGLSGFLQPSTSTRETLTNTGAGTVLGPASLAVGRGLGALYQAGKSAIEPLFAGGQQRIAGRSLQAFAGTPEEAAAAVQHLANSPDVLPGVQPTTAELANNAGLAQFERSLRNNPELSTTLTARNQANRAAMTGALQNIAGSDNALTAAIKARAAATEPLYAAAGGERVFGDPQLEGLLQRPSLQSAWGRAVKLAGEQNDVIPATPSMEPPKPPQFQPDINLPARNTATPDATEDSILQYLAKHQLGLNSAEAEAQGIDKAAFTDRTANVGIKRAFRSNGMPFDQAAEHLSEVGYPVLDEAGNYSPNVLLDRISEELRGSPTYSSRNTRAELEYGLGRQYDDFQRSLGAAPAPPKPAEYSGKVLQYLKMGLNDLADVNAQKGIGAHEQNALNATRAQFGDWISNNVPTLRSADQRFAQLSGPVNQMQIGRTLSDRLLPSLSDFGNNTRLNANSFANTVRNGDQLARQVTGTPGATLASVLSPPQMTAVRQVGEQLARRANADELGRAVGSNTGQNLVSQNMIRQFLGPLGLPQSMAEKAAQSTLGQTVLKPMQWLGSLGERGVLGHLANAALNPQQAAALLRQAQRNPALARALWANQGLLSGATVGGSRSLLDPPQQ